MLESANSVEVSIELTGIGGAAHAADLAGYRDDGIPVPHYHSSWPRYDTHNRWRWCRAVDSAGRLHAAFAIELSASRALPGTLIGRVERIGRSMHAGAPDSIGEVLMQAAKAIPRLQFVDVQVFDENEQARTRLGRSIVAAGGIPITRPKRYTRTLVLDLRMSEEELLASFSASTRRQMRKFNSSKAGSVLPIADPRYLERMNRLYHGSFSRTGAQAPPMDFRDVLNDARDSGESVLLGLFWHARSPPEDLVSFVWGRCHGDYVSYDAAGSERAADLGNAPLGQPLMWELIQWCRRRDCAWLDLGGITPANSAAGHPLGGIAQFKRGFTNEERILADEYRLVPRPRLAAAAHRVRAVRELFARGSG